MKKLSLFLIIVFSISFSIAQNNLSDHLKPFEHFVGKTWVGKFSGPNGEKMRDVSKWESILNGQAIRVVHSLNNGEYGGETVLFYDQKEKRISFDYFTTAGFKTEGYFEIKDDQVLGYEEVAGNQDGITMVKSISKFTSDTSFEVISKYLKNDEWIDGHHINYKLDNSAKLIFK